jgi:hypothetical protein
MPVIDSLNPDALEIPGGFEAGSSLKLTIDGETAYYMISSTMETTGVNRWDHMRVEIWISNDGSNWRRHRTLFKPRIDPETGLWQLTGSPFLFFDESEDRWFVYFNYMAFSGIKPWNTPCLLRRAGARERGMEGIRGEFEFPGEIVAPSGIAHPTDAEASSISPPFKAADGKWYAFLGGGPEPFNASSGRWLVLIVKAASPKGPFTFIPEFAPVPFMDPTGFVENPLPMKFIGPKTGKEYWAIIFNYLKGEVTTGKNSEIGFSFSFDGLTCGKVFPMPGRNGGGPSVFHTSLLTKAIVSTPVSFQPMIKMANLKVSGKPPSGSEKSLQNNYQINFNSDHYW